MKEWLYKIQLIAPNFRILKKIFQVTGVTGFCVLDKEIYVNYMGKKIENLCLTHHLNCTVKSSTTINLHDI